MTDKEKTDDDYLQVLKEIEEIAQKVWDGTSELSYYIYKNRKRLNRNPEHESDMQLYAWNAGRFPFGVIQAVEAAREAECKKNRKKKKAKA